MRRLAFLTLLEVRMLNMWLDSARLFLVFCFFAGRNSFLVKGSDYFPRQNEKSRKTSTQKAERWFIERYFYNEKKEQRDKRWKKVLEWMHLNSLRIVLEHERIMSPSTIICSSHKVIKTWFIERDTSKSLALFSCSSLLHMCAAFMCRFSSFWNARAMKI